MSIRIGNTVYIPGMDPIVVEPRIARDFELLSKSYEVDENTLKDLLESKPGGMVRVGRIIP